MPGPDGKGLLPKDEIKPGDVSAPTDANLDVTPESIQKPEPPKEDPRSALQALINDQKTQREDIDKHAAAIQYVGEKMEEFRKIMDAQTKILNSLTQGGTLSTGNNQLDQLNTLLDSKVGEKLLNKLLPEEPQAALFDQNYINEKIKASVTSSFDIGEALQSNLKSKLMQKAVSQSVTDAFKDTEHGPA